MALSPKSENKSYLFMFAILVISSIYTTFISSNTTMAVVLCIVPIAWLLVQTVNHLKVNVFFFIWVCWNLLNILHMSFDSNSYFFRVLIFQNIVIGLIFFASQYSCSSIQFEATYKVINSFTIVLCFVEIFFSITGRTEGFSFVLFGLMYFFICEKGKKRYIKLVLMTIAFLFGKSRSSILMLFCCLLFCYVFKKVRKNKVWYKITFWIVALIVCLIPYGYVCLYRSSFRNYLNNLSRSIFGKNFFSGRNILWVQIYEWLEQHNLLWGIGSEFVGGTYSEQLGASTHNVILFLLGQGGLILVFLFFIMLYKIYMLFFKYLDDPIVLAGSAFLLGLMIRSCFDLILIANQFVPSMYAWLSICMVLSYCNYLKKVRQISNTKCEAEYR